MKIISLISKYENQAYNFIGLALPALQVQCKAQCVMFLFCIKQNYVSNSFFRSHAHFSKLVSTGLRSTAIFTFLASRSGELIVMDFLLKTTIFKFDHFISLNNSIKNRIMTLQKFSILSRIELREFRYLYSNAI